MSVPAFRRCGVPSAPRRVTGLPAAQPPPMVWAQGDAGCLSTSITMMLSTTYRPGLYFKA